MMLIDWKPIETAPTDGTRIVLWRPERGVVCPGYYCDDSYSKKPKPYWSDQGVNLFGVRSMREDRPTHWAPIPQGPVEAKGNP
jgi:hypothetical protein